MHLAQRDTTPGQRRLPTRPQVAPPAQSAACCTSWDRSDIPVRLTDFRSESACGSAPPIPTGLLLQECATTRIGGSFLRSQTLESARRSSAGRRPSNRAEPAFSTLRRAAREYLRYEVTRRIDG